jgi:GNAT superfamily N-acetyltransferase
MTDRRFIERIEEAALNAWPAPRQFLYDGWVIRFAEGYTKRANSVNVRYPSSLPLKEKIGHCEKVYAAEGQPVIFRLPEPFTSDELRHALMEEGYSSFDPTFVLGREITIEGQLPVGLKTRHMLTGDWIRLRAHLTGTSLSEWRVHVKILDVIVPEKALLGLFRDDMPVACGMGVVEGPLLGYFSIYTAPSERRRGYGRAVMRALSYWGLDRGAEFGYLQVEGDNAPALALYARLGFEQCYQYCYSMKFT